MAAAGLALAVSTSQALALSCAQPSVERSFKFWDESEKTYYIGVGTLKPLSAPSHPNKLPGLGGRLGNAEPTKASYLFSGELLDGEQGHPYEMPITVSVSCLSVWCGAFPKTGVEGLMALRGTETSDLTLDIGPCPGEIFPAATKATVQACIRDGGCAK